MRSLPLKATVAVGAVLCACALFLATAAWSSRASNKLVGSQSSEKVVETIPSIFNEPIKVVGGRRGQRELKFGQKFTGDKDWLKGAEFTLRNLTAKNIVFVELDVNLPETQASGAETSFRINLGQIPGFNVPARTALSLPAGGELTVNIDEERYEQLTRLVEQRHAIASINRARVFVGFVIFDDGLAWSAGSFYRQDPNNPKAWLPTAN
jgi:hypothetical protein